MKRVIEFELSPEMADAILQRLPSTPRRAGCWGVLAVAAAGSVLVAAAVLVWFASW